jgi:hypothetical protein
MRDLFDLGVREVVLLSSTVRQFRPLRAIGDISIGHLVSRAVSGTDGAWPHEAVRDVLEVLGCNDLEQGMQMGVHNA